MAPSRVPDMSKIAIRTLIAGTVACFMTACVAGEIYKCYFRYTGFSNRE